MNKLKHGHEFEVKARDYLKENGFLVIASNVRYAFGEIDIVAEKGSCLVFVEVRKRDANPWITPEESVTFPKARRLKLAVQAYLARYKGKAQSARIDLIGFSVDLNGVEVLKHFENFI